MQLAPAGRIKFSRWLLCLALLASFHRLLRHEGRFYPYFEAGIVDRSERRLRAARAHLEGEEIIGYVGSYPVFKGVGEGDAAYYLAQYSLAPVIVDWRPNHRVALGDFSLSAGEPPPKPIPGLQIWTNLGEGAVLYHRDHRP